MDYYFSSYEICGKTSTLNCRLSDPNNLCQLCKKGYVLNDDYKCTKISLPFCESSNLILLKYFGMINNLINE